MIGSGRKARSNYTLSTRNTLNIKIQISCKIQSKRIGGDDPGGTGDARICFKAGGMVLILGLGRFQMP